MDNLFGMGILLDFEDKASAGLLKTKSIFNQTKQSAEELTSAIDLNNKKYQQLAGISATVAIAGAGIMRASQGVFGALKIATTEAKSFEVQMKRLQYVAGATSEELKALEKTAIETGINTAFSPQESVRAMYELISSGLSANNMLKALQPTLALVAASSGEIDLESGATMMAATLNKFNLAASESVRVADMLAELTRATAFKFSDLAPFMNSLGSAPAKMQRPMEELLAMGGLLRNIGQQGAQAGKTVQGFGRKLLMITAQLKSGTMKGAKANAMKAIGLDAETIWDAEGNMRSMLDIFKSLTDATANMTQQDKVTYFQQIFGDQAGNMLNAVDTAGKGFYTLDKATGKYIETTREGKKSFSDMVEQLKSVDGASKDGANAFLETTAGVEKLWEGTKQTFGVLFGQTVLPIIKSVVQGMTAITNAFLKFGYKYPFIFKILGYGLGIAGLLLGVLGIALILAGAIGGLVAGFGMLTGAVASYAVAQGLADASMMTGIGLMGALEVVLTPLMVSLGALATSLLGIVAVLAFLWIIWKTDFAGIKTTLTKFTTNTKSAFTNARKIVAMDTKNMIKSMDELKNKNDFFSGLTKALVNVNLLWTGITDAWNDNTLSVENYEKLKSQGLLPIIELFLDWKFRIEAFVKGVAKGYTEISEKVKKVFGEIGKAFEPVTTAISDILKGFGFIKTDAQAVKDTLGPALDSKAWEEIGRWIGILGAIFVTAKIATFLWGIGVAIATATIFIWGQVVALIAWIAAGGWIPLLIFAIILAIGWLIKNWKNVQIVMGIFVEWAKDQLGKFGKWLGGLFAPVAKGASEVWANITKWISDAMQTAKDFAKPIFDWFAEKFGWIGDGIGAVGKFFGDLGKGASKAWDKTFGTANSKPGGATMGGSKTQTRGAVGMATGGYVRKEGMALLHPDEIVVNDSLTQKLASFLNLANLGSTAQRGSASIQKATMIAKSSADITDYKTKGAGNSGEQKVDNSVTFADGAIRITLEKGSVEDADNLAKMIMDRIARETKRKNTMSYKPAFQ